MTQKFINDVDKPVWYVDRHGKEKLDRDYIRWYSMKYRYDVCSEWRTRSVFEGWLSEQLDKFPANAIPQCRDFTVFPNGYHLNQAILGRGTKLCSPETYVLIPDYVWAPLRQQSGSAKNLPAGVRNNSRGEGYYSTMSKGRIVASHYFKEPMKAHQHWQAMKVDHLTEVIEKYFGDPSYDGRVMKVILDLAEKIAQDIWDGVETKQPLLDNLPKGVS